MIIYEWREKGGRGRPRGQQHRKLGLTSDPYGGSPQIEFLVSRRTERAEVKSLEDFARAEFEIIRDR